MVIEQAQKTYKDIQSEYDKLYQTEPVRDEDRAYRWHAERLLKENPGTARVLDIACGGGYFLREIQRATDKRTALTGIDISSQAIHIAQKECPGASYLISVAEDLPFRDQQFDAITCLGSMEHFLDLDRAAQEMRRIAKKDTVFYILLPNLFWYKDILSVLFTSDRITRNQTHERFASLGEWQTLLESLGLRILKSEKYNGIAKSPFKQWLKDVLIPLRFSYHFLFICSKK